MTIKALNIDHLNLQCHVHMSHYYTQKCWGCMIGASLSEPHIDEKYVHNVHTIIIIIIIIMYGTSVTRAPL